jgi:3'-phosphoadenosine 5'-phosphosulfate sulfotransferase (PAPS reductase)/FAD synthetase
MFHESYYWALEMIEEQFPTLHIVSLSSGVSSALAADRFPNAEMVFMDTHWEDEDNYRFLLELCQKREWKVDYLSVGKTPLQVAEGAQIIPNQKIAPCTRVLKIEPFVEYVKGWQNLGYRVVIVLGMNHTERKRTYAPIKNYAKIGAQVCFPLIETPNLHPLETVRSWGIEPPRMYGMGYKHANCGGRCVKQGQRDWRRTLDNFPDRFTESESWEAKMQEDPRFSDYAFLRDESGGEVKAKSLKTFRGEIEQRDQLQPRLWDVVDDLAGCSLECGAGDPGDLAA